MRHGSADRRFHAISQRHELGCIVAASAWTSHLLGRSADFERLCVTWAAWDEETESPCQPPRCRAAHMREPSGSRHHTRADAAAKKLERLLLLSRNANDLFLADNRTFLLDLAKKSNPRRTRGSTPDTAEGEATTPIIEAGKPLMTPLSGRGGSTSNPGNIPGRA